MLQTLFIIGTALLLLFILILLLRKAGLQLQFLRLKDGREEGKITDIVNFDWADSAARQKRWEAFLLFPMPYAVVLDEDDGTLNNIKKEVKRIHILIYFVLIILIVMGIYSEKVFPQNA